MPAALAACLAISAIHDLYAKKASFDDQGVLAQAVASTAQVGIGLYLMLAAGVGLVLIACLVPLYWRTPPETFVRWCAIIATIVGTALFVRLQLDHGLLIGAMLGAAIVGMVWLLLAAWRIFGHHGRSRWIAVFVVATIGLLGVFLLGKFFSSSKTPVPGEHAVASTVTNLPASTASTSWHYVLYKGRRADYRLVVPSYFQEAQSSLDSDADRSFVGPGGIVVSAYTVAATKRFLGNLRTSHGLRGAEAGETHTYQSRSGDAVTEQGFKVTGDAVGGQQLLLVLIIVRPNLTYALAVYVPDIWPERVRLGAGWNLGMIAGATHRLEVGQQSPDDLTKPHDNLEANLYEELAAAGWHPGYSSTEGSPDQRPTRAQWKNKVSKNFGWLPGVPVTAQASRFQQVMGKPDDTQTLGDQTLWYYRCADGTIQLAMSALNLQMAGYMQAEVNDY